MLKKIGSRDIVYGLLWVWILLNCFTAMDTEWMPGLSGTNSVLRMHNIFFLFFIAYSLCRRKWEIPKKYFYILLLFTEITFVWLVNVHKYGLSSGYISTVYGMLIMFFVASMVVYIDMDTVCRIFESVAIIVAVMIILNLLLHINRVVSSLATGWEHPDIDVFFGGGVNIEATWMTMLGVFFRKKWRYRYWIFSVLLSVIYVSRTAIIVNILLLFLYLYKDGKRKLMRNIFILMGIFSIVLFISYKMGILNVILERFASTGNDNGSMGRLVIWKAVIKGIKNSPFGVGCGNTMDYLKETYGLLRSENNAHNIYLQCFLENNIVGFLLFISGIVKLYWTEFKNRFSNPCGLLLVLYTFQGMFQMQLKEPLMFLVLALYLTLPYEYQEFIIDSQRKELNA